MENYRTIFKAIVGSQAYGTNTPNSDIDHKFIYIQPESDIYSFKYQEQLSINKDNSGYEIKRFLELLKTANPSTLELLFTPADCIVERTPEFEFIERHRDKFVTKKVLKSFGAYGTTQIQKASGLDKKINWEKNKTERKTPLDFCYYYNNGKTYHLKKFLDDNNLKQEYCGLVALNHFRDCYSLYYSENLEYRGIIFEGKSNDIHLSSIPMGQEPIAIIFYNKDGYSMHCREYKEYQEWLTNRNTQRYIDTKNHGQTIDGKNLLHCRRILNMALEIGEGKGMIIKRPDAQELLKIRHGEVNLQEILEQAQEDIKKLDGLYKACNLPEDVDEEFLNKLLLEIRYFSYKVPQIY